jgi:Oxidoreductase molybdopterin binding domain
VTPRGTDWTLAALVAALAATGALTLFGGPWVFALHGTLGFALGAVAWVKLRRVRRRLRAGFGVAALALVAATLASGWAWSSGARASALGYDGLAWHDVLGALLAAGVLAHAVGRARRVRPRDLGRRQLLIGAGAFALWEAQRPLARALGWRGGRRRWTGSYEAASFAGNAFPTTSWVADAPAPLTSYALRVGTRSFGLAELDAGHTVTATLDCTGGFYSTQEWRGIRVGELLARAGAHGSHVSVVSVTGYRWSFALADGELLLATHVGGEPLSHGHGAPARLVAPGRRGFQWVKWVTRLEAHDGPDLGAPASTLWSSFTPRGRGA